MSHLYIDRSGAALALIGKSLEIRAGNQSPVRLPLAHVEAIVIRGQATFDSGFLAQCWSRQISVQLLSGRRNEPTARFDGANHKDARLRLKQSALHLDTLERRRIAALVVRSKLLAQRRTLRLVTAPRNDARMLSLKALDAMGRARGRLSGTPPSLETLRGVEGAASAAYFRAFSKLFPPSLEFTNRRRRPPPDPVNAVLSLTYTLATAEAARALAICGFDPAIGFLHDLGHGRPALALDLVEPLRPKVDLIVLKFFRERVLTAQHFKKEPDGSVLIGKAARSRIYENWEECRPSIFRQAANYARSAARQIRNVDG